MGRARVGGSGGWSWRGGEQRILGRPHVVGLLGCGRHDMGWSWRLPERFGSGRRPWYPPVFCDNIVLVGYGVMLASPGPFCFGFSSIGRSRVGPSSAADGFSGAHETVGSTSC